jgi:PAS domain S-box-containing protein
VVVNGTEKNESAQRTHPSEERLRLAEAAGEIGSFDLDLDTGRWDWSRSAASLLGLNSDSPESLAHWEKAVFFDDVPKIAAAVEAASKTGDFYVEFRITRPEQPVRWIVARGELMDAPHTSPRKLVGAIYDITERKTLEARLLALNETLEPRRKPSSRHTEPHRNRGGG